MQFIDGIFLNREIKNKNNKQHSARDCEKTLLQFFHTQLNIYELIRSIFKKYELILWIKSNEVYIKRKNTFHINSYEVGQIVLADFGKNIGNELSYEHFAVVVNNQYDKIFVVPCSSSKINKAYNKKTGMLFDEYLIGEVADGFSKKTVIMLRDSKWISKSRVLKSTKQHVDKKLFDLIYSKLFSELFEPREYLIKKLTQENDILKNTIKELKNKPS